jgi:pilus assembly protein CpaB
MKPARLIVLIIAIAAGGIAALLAGRSDQAPPPPPAPIVQIETVDVLIANSDIGMGTAVTSDALRWQTWPAAAAGPSFIRKTDRPDAVNQLVGEPIREAKLVRADGSGYMAAILSPGMRAVSTEISPETGAGGFILPNDRVDVILARRDKEAEKSTGVEVHTSETILANVRVLAIDQTVEEKNGQRVVVGKTATLELSPRQAETLAVSRQRGTLSLALRSLMDAGKTESVSDDNSSQRSSISVVRFGVPTMAMPR